MVLSCHAIKKIEGWDSWVSSELHALRELEWDVCYWVAKVLNAEFYFLSIKWCPRLSETTTESPEYQVLPKAWARLLLSCPSIKCWPNMSETITESLKYLNDRVPRVLSAPAIES